MAGRLERSAEEGANGKRPGRQSRRSRPRGAGCWEAEQLEKDEEEAGVDFLSGATWGGGGPSAELGRDGTPVCLLNKINSEQD